MKLLICTQTIDKNDPILGFFHGWVLAFGKHFKEVHVLCLKKGVYDFPEHIHVYSLGKEEGESRIKYCVRFYRYFGKIFLFTRVDFVFFHMGAIYNILAAPFFFVRKFFNSKFYWWKVHGHLDLVGKTALLLVDAVYTATDDTFPIKTDKKKIIGHAVLSRSAFIKNREINSPIIMGCVGRITPVKHIEVAIETIQTLKRSGIMARLVIVGEFIDSQYKKLLDNRISGYGLLEDINFLGPLPHAKLLDFYSTLDFLVHPSMTGGIDKVVLEAMQEGVIPFAFQNPYGKILGKDLCVLKNTPKDFSEKIYKILNITNTDYNNLRQSLREKVLNEHSLDTLSRRIFNV